MNSIFIYGAGGAGRELAFNLSMGAFWRVAGFIDDTPEKKGKTINRIPVLGGMEYLQGFDHGRAKQRPRVAVAIVDSPKIKRQIIQKLMDICYVEFPIICVPHNLVSPFVEIGEGTLIAQPFNYIPSDSKIGQFVWINSYSGIGHDSQIGDYTTLFSRINVGGGVIIGHDCVIGSGVTIRPYTKIGNNVVIGGGSVVVKDVPDNLIVAGNPAKVLKENKEG